MFDQRLQVLAQRLVHYSCAVQPGENVLIEATGSVPELVRCLIAEVYAAGGNPFVQLNDPRVVRNWLRGANREQLKIQGEIELGRMKQMQCFIGVRAGENVSEMSDVPAETMKAYTELVVKPVHLEQRVKHTKWVILRYPNPSMAQLAQMSTEQFEDFYFKVCTLDYAKMSTAMTPLKELMDRTDRVHIISPGTDLTFSIKGIPSIKCDGKMNIPDGEVFTSPVIDSVNGVITYNASTLYHGATFDQVSLTFENGKIVNATSSNTQRLNEILDTDAGARFIGEFAVGFHPDILHPMKDILFDEKIAGSIHFTPGQAYEEADNGNRSSIHWDLVLIQRPEYGGGELYFDDVLIRKDGIFVIPELLGLNPDQLQ